MSLIKEPKQDVDNVGNKISELARKNDGSGSSPTDLNFLVAKVLLKCTVEEFKITALSVFNDVETNP